MERFVAVLAAGALVPVGEIVMLPDAREAVCVRLGGGERHRDGVGIIGIGGRTVAGELDAYTVIRRSLGLLGLIAGIRRAGDGLHGCCAVRCGAVPLVGDRAAVAGCCLNGEDEVRVLIHGHRAADRLRDDAERRRLFRHGNARRAGERLAALALEEAGDLPAVHIIGDVGERERFAVAAGNAQRRERGTRGGIVIDLRAVAADDAPEVARRAVSAGDEDRAAALGDGLVGRVFRRYGRCGLGIHGDAAEGRCDGAGIVYELAVDIRAVILHRCRDGERGRRRAVNGLGGFVALLIVPLYTRRAGRSGGERDGVALGQRLAGGTHILRENGLGEHRHGADGRLGISRHVLHEAVKRRAVDRGVHGSDLVSIRGLSLHGRIALRVDAVPLVGQLPARRLYGERERLPFDHGKRRGYVGIDDGGVVRQCRRAERGEQKRRHQNGKESL